jgi:hypothetical protein
MGTPCKYAMPGLKAHNFNGWVGLKLLLLGRLIQAGRYHLEGCGDHCDSFFTGVWD